MRIQFYSVVKLGSSEKEEAPLNKWRDCEGACFLYELRVVFQPRWASCPRRLSFRTHYVCLEVGYGA